jgi:hypothetical protein
MGSLSRGSSSKEGGKVARKGVAGEPTAEREFWERYWEVLRMKGVKAGMERWYERSCAQFIRVWKPRRLKEATAKDVTQFLGAAISDVRAGGDDRGIERGEGPEFPGKAGGARQGVGLDAEPGAERAGDVFPGGAVEGIGGTGGVCAGEASEADPGGADAGGGSARVELHERG